MEESILSTAASRSDTARSSRSFLERLGRYSIPTRSLSQKAGSPRGADGLNLLNEPSETDVDLIFVHGLRGGSRKTWSISENPSDYWPKEWLPGESGFENVRIHSYGYNSDWADRKGSVLDIHDFGKSLLADLSNCPEIRRSAQTPLILVGHSMGGLVIKKAYLLATRDPSYTSLAHRIRAMVFLGTPHRGADSAQLLSNLLSVAFGVADKNYVQDLIPNSGSLLAINDEFRNACRDVEIWSFYESLKTRLGLSQELIVPKDSAVIGLPGDMEHTQPMATDHRHLCKFPHHRDPNYVSLRNVLLTIVEGVRQPRSVVQGDEKFAQLKRISHYLSAPERPEDQLELMNALQVEGSCSWIQETTGFRAWHSDQPIAGSTSAPRVLWLRGKPGSGKSVMAGHIIKYLGQRNVDCSYYFFKHNNEAGLSLSALLRSIAYQMAETNSDVRRELHSMVTNGVSFNKDDELSVWRALFTSRILCRAFRRPHYWVIDALDECPDYETLFPLLSKVDKLLPIKFLVTSRQLPLAEGLLAREKLDVAIKTIGQGGTLRDVRLLVDARADLLPVEDDSARLQVTEEIVQKSNGSLLWTSLVLKELGQTHSERQVREVLSQVPTEMEDLYRRILVGLKFVPRNQELVKAIFRWLLCVRRPLSSEELKVALMLDTGHVVARLDAALASLTGSLVGVGADGKVQLVHGTLKSFLTRPGLDSEYAVDRRKEHSRLAEICLTHLVARGLQLPTHDSSDTSKLTSYATIYFSYHLAESSSVLDKPLVLLDGFLRIGVLRWIELVARAGDLDVLLRTSRDLKAYLDRRAKYEPPLRKEVQRARAWADDLIRIVAAFGRNILSVPESIHSLVPSLSPRNSIIHREFKGVSRSIEVVGSSLDHWDDRIGCLSYPCGQALCVTSWESRVAVGLSSGAVMLYKTTTFEDTRTLQHGEPVRHLCFATSNDFLASSGRRKLSVWDPDTGVQLWSSNLDGMALAMSFTQRDSTIIIATRSNKMMSFETRTGFRVPDWSYFDMNDNEDTTTISSSQPTHISTCSERNLLAVAYLNRPINFWDLEDNSWLGHFHKGGRHVYPGPRLLGLTINPNPGIDLAAAAFDDGDLVVFDPFDGQLRRSVETSAHTLTSSPDGRTLATGDGNGNIQLFAFETLQLLYRVSANEYNIKSIVFTSDSLRFFDLQSNQCNIWEPTALVRGRDPDDLTSEPYSEELLQPALVLDYKPFGGGKAITTICEHHSGSWIFAGREDGSVAVFDTATGQEAEEIIKPAVMAVKLLLWSSTCSRLAIADTASRVTVRSTSAGMAVEGKWAVSNPTLSVRADRPIRQLLFNSSGQLLLISTDALDEVWDVEHGKLMGSRPRTPSSKSWTWVDYPASTGKIVLLQAGCAHVYDWENLSSISKPEGVFLSGSGGPEAHVDRILTTSFGQSMCIRFVKPWDTTAIAGLQIYSTSTLESQAGTADSVTQYAELTDRIKCIIGVYKSRMLFLDVDGWVCSLNIDTTATEGHYTRHFFIPSSWYNMGDILFTVTTNGSVALARWDEIIVFHHGLEFFEQRITLDPVKNPGLAAAVNAQGDLRVAAPSIDIVKFSRRRRPGVSSTRQLAGNLAHT